MDITKSSLLSSLAARLQYLAARTGVISENIANADTPDYAARDLAAPNFKKLTAAATQMRVSDPRHIKRAALSSASIRPHAAPDPDAALNGNKVSLETQMMKLSETRMDYQLASTVYRKGLSMLRMAARGGR